MTSPISQQSVNQDMNEDPISLSSSESMIVPNLPVELIGKILSNLRCVRDVIRASATCRLWWEAFSRILGPLSFDYCDNRHVYDNLRVGEIEILITKAIFKTMELQELSVILMGVKSKFSGFIVVSWLLHCRKTLRKLTYAVDTTSNVDVLGICGRQKLEVLNLYYNRIDGISPSFHRFPCLKSLRLSGVKISPLDLKLLLMACPKIEILELLGLELTIRDEVLELSSTTLKTIFIQYMEIKKLTIEAENIQRLTIELLSCDMFELIGQGSLKHFDIFYCSFRHLETGKAIENLELLSIGRLNVVWPVFYQAISKASKLWELILWDVIDGSNKVEIVDFKKFAVHFQQLGHLFLRDDMNRYDFEGCHVLKNMVILEVVWTTHEYFLQRMEQLLSICPNLKKLIIRSNSTVAERRNERQMLADDAVEIFDLMRKYKGVELELQYQ